MIDSIDALLDRAEAALAADRLPEATALLESVVRSSASDVSVRSRALLGLGRAYGRSGRFFEAAVVGRHLLRHERDRASGADEASALALIAVALLNAKAPDRARPVMEELGAALAARTEEEAPDLHRVLHQARYSLALLDGDLVAAEGYFERLRSMLERGLLGPGAEWLLRNGEFHLAMARGDIESMEAILRDVLSGERQANVYVPEVSLRLGLADAYAAAGRPADAQEQAASVLEFVRRLGNGSDVLIDDAAQLALLLHRELGDTKAALEMADLAAAALLERLRQLQQSAATLATVLGAEDDPLLAGLREEFHDVFLGFLKEVRAILRAAGGAAGAGDPSTGPETVRSDLVRVCAWCGGIGLAPETWIPLNRLVQSGPLGGVTHGICPSCRLRADSLPAD